MTRYRTFETPRLHLRPILTSDAAFILELLSMPKWLQYIGDRNVKSMADAENYIKARMLPQLEKHGYGNYAVVRKSDQQILGSCGLYVREGMEDVDIGFAFLPAFEGQGYAFEAATTIRDAAFEHFGIQTIMAYTTKDNRSSQKLLEKLGLQQSGTTYLPNDEVELLVYKLEKAD